MKNILNNKIFIVLLLAVVLFFTSVSSCFATDYSSFIDTNDTGYLSYDYSSYISEKNYLIYKNNNSSDSYFLLTCEGTIYYNSPYICCNNDSNLYKLESGSISNLGGFPSGSIVGLSNIKLLTSNTNIYDNSADPELVFQVAPQSNQLEITRVLVEQVGEAQIQDQMKTMVGGFLLYLVGFVVLLLAFWKGWNFLSKQLRTA